MADAGTISVLGRETSLEFWRAIRDVVPFAGETTRALWRVSVPPAQGAEVLAKIQASVAGVRAFLDWGGGLLWLQTPDDADVPGVLACGQSIRAALSQSGGHATLVRASLDVRRSVEVFQPQSESLAALSNRVKLQFDPKRVLNPGRMYAGV